MSRDSFLYAFPHPTTSHIQNAPRSDAPVASGDVAMVCAGKGGITC